MAILILLPSLGFGQTAPDPFSIGSAPASQPAPPPTFAPSATPSAPAAVQAPAAIPNVTPPQPAPAVTNPQTGANSLNAPPPAVPSMASDLPNKPAPKGPAPRSSGPAPGVQPATGAEVPPTMSRMSLRETGRSQHVAAANPAREPSEAQLKENPRLIQSMPTPTHPMRGYLELPVEAQSIIRGKAMPIAVLLDGVRNAASRQQLLGTYWELVGSLAEYNCRVQAEQQAASGTRDAQLDQTINLLRQQRRATEIDFVKKQWQLAELLRRHKGVTLSEETLPIPNEYPLVKKYDTHLDRIARSERSRYVGRMIPIQEQLVQARLLACRETFELHKSIPANSQQLLIMLNHRTDAFLDMAGAIVEYNQMIAEYASETIPVGVSRYQFINALVELPKFEASPPDHRPNRQMANPVAPKFSALPETAPNERRQQPEAPESAYAAPKPPVAEHRQPPQAPMGAVAENTPPARPFDPRNADPTNRPPRRQGHPDITQAAFESAVAPEPPKEAIAQASHVEPAPEIPAEAPPTQPKPLPEPPKPPVE